MFAQDGVDVVIVYAFVYGCGAIFGVLYRMKCVRKYVVSVFLLLRR